jgi:hypothetical protein
MCVERTPKDGKRLVVGNREDTLLRGKKFQTRMHRRIRGTSMNDGKRPSMTLRFGVCGTLLSSHLQRARGRAGLGRIRLHDFRHRWGSELMTRARDEYAVMQAGGWTTRAAVARYQHETDGRRYVNRQPVVALPAPPILPPRTRKRSRMPQEALAPSPGPSPAQRAAVPWRPCGGCRRAQKRPPPKGTAPAGSTGAAARRDGVPTAWEVAGASASPWRGRN